MNQDFFIKNIMRKAKQDRNEINHDDKYKWNKYTKCEQYRASIQIILFLHLHRFH